MAVPAIVTIAVNLVSLLFSLYQLKSVSDGNIGKGCGSLFLVFLAKLLAVQSLQWTFGVVYFFARKHQAKVAFEILVAFEGLFMALSYFITPLKKYVSKFKTNEQSEGTFGTTAEVTSGCDVQNDLTSRCDK